MKNFRRSKKALSPVVASIILIAVTVAVSIAVAAWMGALSVGFMQTEQLSITNAVFDPNDYNEIVLTVKNTGATDIVLKTTAWVNGETATAAAVAPATMTITKNTEAGISVSGFATNWATGNSYQIKLISEKGTNFVFNAVASP